MLLIPFLLPCPLVINNTTAFQITVLKEILIVLVRLCFKSSTLRDMGFSALITENHKTYFNFL